MRTPTVQHDAMMRKNGFFNELAPVLRGDEPLGVNGEEVKQEENAAQSHGAAQNMQQ